LLKAAERSFDLGIGCELAALGLRKTLSTAGRCAGSISSRSPSFPVKLSMASAM
jgi:hypothetical protein